MDKETVERINKECPYGQGIFLQPSYVPINIKELVVYTVYDIGGYRGGSCWGNKPEYVNLRLEDDRFVVLDMVLNELFPNITYLQYRKILKLIHTNEDTTLEYYGNSTDHRCEYIVLSELEKLINEMKG